MTRIKAVALAALGFALFLAIWELAPALGFISASVLPPPSVLPQAFLRELSSGIWFAALLTSLRHYLAGLVIGCTLGVGLGVATGMSDTLEASLAWVIRVLRPIPGLAWVPFAILWFGIDATAAIFIIGIGVFWISYFAAHGAVRAVDRDLIEVAEAFGFRRARPEADQGHPAVGGAGDPRRPADRIGTSMDGGGGVGDLRRAWARPAHDAGRQPARERCGGRLHGHHGGALRHVR